MRVLIEVILDKRRTKSSGLYAVKVRVTYLRQQKYYYVGLDMSQDEFRGGYSDHFPVALIFKPNLSGNPLK